MTKLNGVDDSYRHYAKQCAPGELIEAAGARFKYYEIATEESPVSVSMAEAARASIEDFAEQSEFCEESDVGFVILHRCGETFHFLLWQIWRGSNEVWEAVYYTDEGMDGFAPFGPANPGGKMPLRPTFCIWELAAVAHEARAWARLLETSRSKADVDAYLANGYVGTV